MVAAGDRPHRYNTRVCNRCTWARVFTCDKHCLHLSPCGGCGPPDLWLNGIARAIVGARRSRAQGAGFKHQGVVAEWLTRLTRMVSPRRGIPEINFLRERMFESCQRRKSFVAPALLTARVFFWCGLDAEMSRNRGGSGRCGVVFDGGRGA